MNRMVVWLLAGLLPLGQAALAAADQPAEEASVLVTTETPVQGRLDQPVVAYGAVQPAPAGAMAVASLHAAQVQQLRVVAGQVVKQGEPLLDLGSDPAASLAYAQAASDLNLAQAEYARIQRMVAQRLATASQLDQAAKAVRDAEATLKARQREGGGKPVETVLSPISGVVTTVAVGNGDHVQAGTTLLDLARSDQLVGLLGIPPEDRGRVSLGQAVTLVDLDLPATPIAGTVASVGGMSDAKTGLIAVVVAPTGPGTLVPGAHLRAFIDTGKIEGWIVPRNAVLSDDKGPSLFQVEGGKAKRVAVTVVGAAQDRVAVSGPIDPGKKIVVAGNYQLTDGMAVRDQATPPQSASEQSEGGQKIGKKE